jgi:UDPglucose 6-dehydrogenase
VNAITAAAKKNGYNPRILNAVLDVNETQPLRMVTLAKNKFGDVSGKRVALLGLSFKPDTDDVRYTRALPIAESFVDAGAEVVAYDPKATENFKKLTDKNITYVSSGKEALKDADMCIIQSDWAEFKSLTSRDFKELMKTPNIIDGRRTYDPRQMIEDGIAYIGIGWKNGF